MALLSVPIDLSIRASKEQLFDLFCAYAGYFEDAPHKPYAIRIGSRTFYSDDTADLRKQFNRRVGVLKRKEGAPDGK